MIKKEKLSLEKMQEIITSLKHDYERHLLREIERQKSFNKLVKKCENFLKDLNESFYNNYE